MKILVAVLSGLLLVIYSQQNCQKEPDKTYYYIYNISVEVKAYYCSYTEKEDLQCEHSNNGKLLENDPSDIVGNCGNSVLAIIKKVITWKRLKVNFCELSGRTSLLGNTVKFSDDAICSYQKGKCYNNNIAKDVFWTVSNICQSIVLIGNGNYNVWTNVQDQTMFISDNFSSLILTEKLKLCRFEMWKTNLKNIIVSKNATFTKERCINCPMYENNLHKFCEDSEHATTKQTPAGTPKTWYLYKYPTVVTVHICLTNLTDSCKDMKLQAGSENNTDLCISNFCHPSSPCIYKSNTTICQATMQVDLEKDLVRDLPPECKYSDGFCESLQTFWLPSNRCRAISIAYEGYEEQIETTKYVTDKYNYSTKWILLREGNLCGNTVWFTDQDGLVASETELEFSVSTTDDDLELLLSQQNQDISRLQTTLFCVKLFVLFCVLWYVFNVIVNFVSLRKLNKARGCKKKAPLINCVSPGLTTRYLYLSREEKNTAVVYDVKMSQLYASVDNELYNK